MKSHSILYCLTATLSLGFANQNLQAQDYRKIHEEAIVVDSHNDVLISVMEGMDISKDLRGKTHSDLPRFKEGGVDVQVFSVWSDETGSFNYAMQQIDSLQAIVRRNPNKMMLATTYKDVMRAVKEQKMATMIGVEGGHMIEDNLQHLEQLRKRGAVYLTLTWNNPTTWATSALVETRGDKPDSEEGLNALGEKIVRRMNKLGMMVDLSHVGEKTFWDVIKVTKKPVLVSHSDVYALNPVFRNLKDDQIKAIAKNGGVIQLNFFSGFLDPEFDARHKKFMERHQAEEDSLRALKWSSSNIYGYMLERYPEEVQSTRPPLSKLFEHLDYIVKLVGVDYVGLGSDFDGISSAPRQLDGVDDFPVITEELVARGYSEADIKKILGGNFLRVLKANAG